MFSSEKIDKTCPKCNKTIQMQIRVITSRAFNGKVTCPHCKEVITVDASELKKELSKAEREVKKLGGKITIKI